MTEAAAPRVAWVTGAAGFMGPHVTARLQRAGWCVVEIDRVPRPTDAPHQITGEITPALLNAALARAGSPALVFHGAGAGTVGESARDSAASLRDTVASVETVLAYLLACAPSAAFFLPSSAAVYGSAASAVLDEDTPLAPLSTYGRHKMAAERACLDAAARGLRVAILRFFSAFGPGLRKQLPWDIARKLAANPARLELQGTGAETRDFFAVSDVAELTAFLAGAAFPAPLIVNGGTGVAIRIDDFARAFAAAAGLTPEIVFNGQMRPDDPVHLIADTSRLESLGFRPNVRILDDGLRSYVTWLKSPAGLNT